MEYLVFRLHGSLYAVRAVFVREMLPLPELIPMEESPMHIAGVFDLRGRIVPVMDLEVRFGHAPKRYVLEDSVVVIERDGALAGIIVSTVLHVADIAASDTEAALPDHFRSGRPHARFIEGEAKTEDGIIMLLSIDALVTEAEAKGPPAEEAEPRPAGHPAFCPDASAEERRVFGERAEDLRRRVEEPEHAGLVPTAVIGLGGERFGIDARLTSEFADITGLAPVPCAPIHVAGNINLRGNIITLVDIRGPLGMSAEEPGRFKKAAIVERDGFLAGVAVEEVLDVVYLREDHISPPPSALSPEDKFIRGTAPYGPGVMTVIDLGKILLEGGLTVDEGYE